MKNKVMQFLREEDGVTALEYGVLAAVVAVVIAATVNNQLKTTLEGLFSQVSKTVTGAATPPAQ